MSVKKANPSKNPPEDTKALDKLIDQAKEVKGKFHKLNNNTKKKVIVGVAGAIALLAGIGMIKKMKRKRRKEIINN